MTITHDYDDDWDYVSRKFKKKGKLIDDSNEERQTIED